MCHRPPCAHPCVDRFPEVTFNLLLGMGERDNVKKCCHYTNFVAYVIHHTGGTLVYISALTELIQPFFLLTLLPLGLQHLVSFIKYSQRENSQAIYDSLILILEVWFQLEVYAGAPLLLHEIPLIGTYMVLSAHYLWFIAAVVGRLQEVLAKKLATDDLSIESERSVEAVHRLPQRLSTMRQMSSLLVIPSPDKPQFPLPVVSITATTDPEGKQGRWQRDLDNFGTTGLAVDSVTVDSAPVDTAYA